MKVAAIIPVKDFRRAKSRLGSVLGEAERYLLAQRFFAHTYDQVARAVRSGIVVLAGSDEVADAARRRGAEVEMDRPGVPMHQRIDQVLASLSPVDGVVVCMADLPLLAATEIAQIVAAISSGADAVLAPDRHHLGTNVLAVRASSIRPTSFGHEDSFLRHLRTWPDATISASRGTSLDIDVPQDLEAWQRAAVLTELSGFAYPHSEHSRCG